TQSLCRLCLRTDVIAYFIYERCMNTMVSPEQSSTYRVGPQLDRELPENGDEKSSLLTIEAIGHQGSPLVWSEVVHINETVADVDSQLALICKALKEKYDTDLMFLPNHDADLLTKVLDEVEKLKLAGILKQSFKIVGITQEGDEGV